MSYSQRSTGDDSKPRGDVYAEVKRLIKAGKTDYSILQQLRTKYKDEKMIQNIFDAYKDRLKFVTKKARRFRTLIVNKYAPMQLSFDEIIKKAKKYAKKYKIEDDEFEMFLNLSMKERSFGQGMWELPNTAMSKLLGYEAAMAVAEKLNVKETELDTVNKILELYGRTKPLHAQIVVQSLSYRDCAAEAISGQLHTVHHNVYSYVHPIVAALFLPRIKLLDEQMLVANMGYIVDCKYKGRPIMTQPDYELYWHLITDPNDHVCSRTSAIDDLNNRYNLQTRLWDSVLNLRQGKYYEENLTAFLSAIDRCSSSIYDAPDLTYVRDEGTIMRRLLSAFSIRPTMVSTTRLYNVLGGTTYGFAQVGSFAGATNITQITTVPIVTLRLPLTVSQTSSAAVSLEEALSQPQWFVENQMIIPKAQSIIHSRDVLFFYVGRRFQTVNVMRMGGPANFTTLPMTVAGWESLNKTVVNYNYRMTIGNDVYQLRSVVFVETSPTRKDLIIGSSAGIVIPMKVEEQRFEESYIIYDPQGASEQFKVPNTKDYTRNQPITWVSGTQNTADSESFYSRASTRGTIFMYEKVTDNPTTTFGL